MEKRKIDKIGIETSLLGFGMMRLPTKEGKIDEEMTMKMAKYAYDNGVNYFDTAWPYHGGESEIVTGKVIKQFERETFYLATKLPLWDVKEKDEIVKILDKQLEKLDVDYIDFYLVHAVNQERVDQIKSLNVMEILEEQRCLGKIKYIGFSFHDELDVFKEAVNLYDWDFCQIQLNYMDVNHQQGVEGYDILTEKGIPVIIMEPVKGGKLTKYSDNIEKMFYDYNSNDSIASWAFRWIGSFDNVKVILSGMSNMDQMKDNIKTFSNFTKINDTENEIIQNVVDKLNSIIRVDCTSCDYCMPCPHGVNIPGNFRIFNDFAMYQNTDYTKWAYGSLKNNNADASICIECGECLPKCPQHIEIPDKLKEVFDELDKL